MKKRWKLVDPNIVNYIRQLLQYGYDINAIRSRLLSSGYPPAIVDEAIGYIYQGTAQQAPSPSFLDHFKTKKFIIAFSGIMGLVLVVFLILTFSGGAPEPISIYISPVSSQVSQGEDVSFTKSMLNLEGSGMVSFSYEIFDISGNTVAVGQETASSQSIPVSSKIAVPKSAAPGSYTLKAVARFGEQSAESRFSFTVIGLPEEIQPETGLEPLLPGVGEPSGDEPGQQPALPSDGINDQGGIDGSVGIDSDNDGISGSSGLDSDNDGILDKFDLYPFDRDNDGIPDSEDLDNDNDGIPDAEDLYPFDFDNDGVLDKDETDDSKRSYKIPAAQIEAELSFRCSSDIDCNDFDACTSDKCIGGVCENTPFSPCCGNFVCEPGETEQTCAQDCRSSAVGFATGATPSGQSMIISILEKAEANPEAAAAECSNIERVEDADYCYFELAKKTGINGFCTSIYTEKTWDSCHMFFVINKDEFEHCPKLHNRYVQNSCYSIESMKNL